MLVKDILHNDSKLAFPETLITKRLSRKLGKAKVTCRRSRPSTRDTQCYLLHEIGCFSYRPNLHILSGDANKCIQVFCILYILLYLSFSANVILNHIEKSVHWCALMCYLSNITRMLHLHCFYCVVV